MTARKPLPLLLLLLLLGSLVWTGSVRAQVIAGVDPVEGEGILDGWTNILYINEQTPFDFSAQGTDEGVLTDFNFWVGEGREWTSMVTPFVVEPLVDYPEVGEDFIVRAIGTTRMGDEDYDEPGLQSFPFHDTEQFTVKTGWLAGIMSSDPEGISFDAMSPVPYIHNAGVEGWETGSSSSGSGYPNIRLNEPIEEGDSGTEIDAWGLRHYQFQIVAGAGGGGATRLQAGDADQNLEFNQLDLVQVQIAAKYLTNQDATWGEGDWDGAPGGSPGNPPSGDGRFNQLDIIAALNANVYLQGPYAALSPGGAVGDGQTSIIYNAATGEVAVDAPAGTELTSVNIDSAAGIFTADPAANLGGSFDNDSDANIFKATFGGSFGSLSFGNVAQTQLAEEVVLADLSVVGSLAGGGDLGNVDLIYVPEPSALLLLLCGVTALVLWRR
jgi:hypothetical protein